MIFNLVAIFLRLVLIEATSNSSCTLSEFCSSDWICKDFPSLQELTGLIQNANMSSNTSGPCDSFFPVEQRYSIELRGTLYKGSVNDQLNLNSLFTSIALRAVDNRPPCFLEIAFIGFTGLDLNLTQSVSSFENLEEWKKSIGQCTFYDSAYEARI